MPGVRDKRRLWLARYTCQPEARPQLGGKEQRVINMEDYYDVG